MAVISQGSFAKDLVPGMNAWFQSEIEAHETQWDKLVDKYSSDRAYEEDAGVSGFGLAPIKPEGQPVVFDSSKQTYVQRYTNVVYALGAIITREMAMNGQSEREGERISKRIAHSLAQTRETVVANMYNRGFNGSYTFADGQPLLSNAHPNDGGTWSNIMATAADLSQSALEQACIDISKFTDHRGLKMAVKPQSLVIPVDEMFNAKRILGSDLEVDTANNALNPVKGIFPKGVSANNFLTDTNAWFIRTDVTEGLKLFEREADRFYHDSDFSTRNALFMGTSYYSVGASDPRAIYGTPGMA